MTEMVWGKLGTGHIRRMTREEAERQGIEFEPVSGPETEVQCSVNLGLSKKLLTPEERKMLFVQTGKHVETWADLKSALGDEHRIVERGDPVSESLERIRHEKALDLSENRR